MEVIYLGCGSGNTMILGSVAALCVLLNIPSLNLLHVFLFESFCFHSTSIFVHFNVVSELKNQMIVFWDRKFFEGCFPVFPDFWKFTQYFLF